MSDPRGEVDNRRRAIGVRIAVIARQSRQRFDERVEALGVTRAKWVLIAAVAANPGATQRLIASKLEITDVTAGRLIERVVADGLLERREHAQDRRAYCLFLTPAAQPVIERIGEAAARYERELFADFSEADLSTLDMLLDRLAARLGPGWPTSPEEPAIDPPRVEADAA